MSTVRVLGNQGEVDTRGELLKTFDVNMVIWSNLIVVGRINKSQSKHALLLEVGLMNTGKAADDDGQTTKEAGLQSRMFTGRALAVVVVTDDDPLDATVAVVGSGRWNSSPFARLKISDLVSFTVSRINSTDQAVLCKQCKRCGKS